MSYSLDVNFEVGTWFVVSHVWKFLTWIFIHLGCKHGFYPKNVMLYIKVLSHQSVYFKCLIRYLGLFNFWHLTVLCRTVCIFVIGNKFHAYGIFWYLFYLRCVHLVSIWVWIEIFGRVLHFRLRYWIII